LFAKLNDTFFMIDDEKGSDIRRVLGANLRRVRIARHLSLSELARTTGMSKATLSGIENAHANPTVETVAGLVDALRISFADLLEQPPLGEIRVVRSTHVQASAESKPQRLLEKVSSNASVEVAELALTAHQTHEAEAKPAGARTHVYVLAGTLIAGPAERYTELASGDYASFPADVPQLYETARHAARALLLTQVPDS
jgi:transcriptional regulator with XRE-family HTH domain